MEFQNLSKGDKEKEKKNLNKQKFLKIYYTKLEIIGNITYYLPQFAYQKNLENKIYINLSVNVNHLKIKLLGRILIKRKIF